MKNVIKGVLGFVMMVIGISSPMIVGPKTQDLEGFLCSVIFFPTLIIGLLLFGFGGFFLGRSLNRGKLE